MEQQGIIIELQKSITDHFQPGDVLQINPENNAIKLVDQEYSPFVIGVCIEDKKEEKPKKKIDYYLNGVDMTKPIEEQIKTKLMISGICTVKIEGHVNIGDLLVSTENGRAKSARYNNDHYNDGKILGKAIQYTEKEDEIIALISIS